VGDTGDPVVDTGDSVVEPVETTPYDVDPSLVHTTTREQSTGQRVCA